MTGMVERATPCLVRKVVWLHVVDGEALCLRPHRSSQFYLPGGIVEGTDDRDALCRHVNAQLGDALDVTTLSPAGSVSAPSDEDEQVRIELVGFFAPASCLPVPSADIAELRYLRADDAVRMSTLTRIFLSQLEAANVVE